MHKMLRVYALIIRKEIKAMKKRVISIILAAVMLIPMLVLTACNDEPDLPIVDNNGTGNAGVDTNGGAGTTDTTAPVTTELEIGENGLPTIYFDDYIANTEAVYTGMVGIGANKAGVDFDNFRVVSSDKKDIIYEEFTEITELNSLVYTGFAAPGGNWTPALSDWVVGVDELDEENKQLTFSAESAEGAMLLMGNSAWGPYRFSVKVKLADETETASVYFCVKDEKNYYELAVSAASVVLNEVKDGEATVINSINMLTPVGEWVPTSVSVNTKNISVYVNGNEMMRVSDAESEEALVTGKFGFGQWNSSFMIDNVQIVDIVTGEVYYSEDFEDADDFVENCIFGNRNGGNYTYTEGDWVVRKETDADGNEIDNMVLAYDGDITKYGAIIAFDGVNIPAECEGYKIVIDVMRTGGTSQTSEGWAIVWGYSADTDYINYNYGGWSGAGGFQLISGGSKTNKNMSTAIGMENHVWATSEVHIYKDVAYSYYNGNLIQLLWF